MTLAGAEASPALIAWMSSLRSGAIFTVADSAVSYVRGVSGGCLDGGEGDVGISASGCEDTITFSVVS